MYVKAIRIDEAQEVTLRVLNAMFGDFRSLAHTTSPTILAAQLHLSEGAVRYQIKKLEEMKCIQSVGKDLYKPTERLLFLDLKE